MPQLKQKTCSRGHKYTGSGACPVCWPSGAKKKHTQHKKSGRFRVKGFTLIELLVVVAIIGLLSSIVVTSLSLARVKARNATRVLEVEQLRTAYNLGLTSGAVLNVPFNYLNPSPCLTTTCSGGWSYAADPTVDAYFAPYIKKPTDPTDGVRGYNGFILITPYTWPGSLPDFPPDYYIEFLLEPGGVCPSNSYFASGSTFVMCITRLAL